MNYNNSTSFGNYGNNNGGMLVLIIIVMIVCVSMLFLYSIVYDYGSSKDSPSPSSESPSPSSESPSPVNCEIDWSEASWAPCTADECPADKISYKYRTATVKQQAKHGGRACPALTAYELLLVSDSVVSSPADDNDVIVSSPADDNDVIVSSPAGNDDIVPVHDPTCVSRAISDEFYILPEGYVCPAGKGDLTTAECYKAHINLGGHANPYYIERNSGNYEPPSMLSCAIKSGSTTPTGIPWIIYTPTYGTQIPNNEVGSVSHAPICKY